MQNCVHVHCSRVKICGFHPIFLGDHNPKKIKDLCLTGKVYFLILSQFSALRSKICRTERPLIVAETPRSLCAHHPGLTPRSGTHGLRLRL